MLSASESNYTGLCRMMEEQIRDWPLMRRGAESLKAVRRKTVMVAGDNLVLQFNPLRTKSTAADVSAEAIAARPCFLCAKNRPLEQTAVALPRGYLALCNPMPIFDMHFTLCHAEHRPQNHPEVFADLLALAGALGPEMCVFYNGAQAGASAPDHLHFQAARAGALPVRQKLPDVSKPCSFVTFAGNDYLLLTGSDAGELSKTLGGFVESHARSTPKGEDLINIAAFAGAGGKFEVVAAFRQKHRPAVFFAEEPARCLISPAAVEMFGVVVTVREPDYEKVDERLLLAAFSEVTKPAGMVVPLLEGPNQAVISK